MVSDLYSGDVLSLAATLTNSQLSEPHGTSRKLSKLCGSSVEVDITLDGDVVSDVAMRVKACALGQASAAILREQIVGATLTDLVAARDGLRAMLKDGAVPPKGRFGRLALLEGVRLYPARHQSTLLAFDAAVAAFESASSK